jgi:hypothetical protein
MACGCAGWWEDKKGFGWAAARITLSGPKYSALMTMTAKSGIMAISFGTALLLCGCASTPRLAGSVKGSTYTSAEGGFSVPFPVSPEVRGRVLNDGPQGVTFGDNWGSRITFKERAILEQSSMMTMLEKQGREKALSEFARREYGGQITIHYHPDAREGMISFIYLRPVSPKTAVAIFLHERRLFLVETDMLPGVQLLAQSDEQSQSDRESWLESRAVALAQSIEVK